MPTKTLFLILLVSFASLTEAKPVIVTTTTTLADLVKNTVGEDFEVHSIALGPQDPHYVEAKPSYMVKVRNAKAIVAVGLELEVGWLPLILRGARNPSLMPGQPGYIDASQFIQPIEVQENVDRSQGDVHALGNPHYLLNPEKTLLVVKGLSKEFQKLFPEKTKIIQSKSESYMENLKAQITKWRKTLVPGSTYVTYHKTLNDFFTGFQLEYAGSIESKPGVPPSANHIVQLMKTMKEKKVSCLLIESFFETTAALRIQKSTNTGIAVVPVEVGATKKATSYTQMMNELVKNISQCRPDEVTR